MERINSIKRLLVLAGLAMGGMGLTGNVQAGLTLPNPTCLTSPDITNCLKLDDFAVYSLAFLNYQAGFGDAQSGDPYYVRSSGKPINDSLVVASHPSVRRDNTDLGVDGDDGYDTPNSVPGGSDFANFLMEAPDPAPNGFTGDNRNQTSQNGSTLPLWDIQVDDLLTFLGGGDLYFFFNLNEENKGGLDDGQDMYTWAEVILSNDTGASTSFILSGDNTSAVPYQSAMQTTGVDDILPNASDLWAWVHGEICVDKTTGALLALGPCTGQANSDTVNQNLGANAAAFAVYSPDLNTALDSGLYDLMTVDFRMSHIDNGYEQLFIQALDRTVQTSEPNVLALFAFGLVGLGFKLRQRVV